MPNLLKILVVEDEPKPQAHYLKILQTAPFQPYVNTAYLQGEGDVEDAVKVILANPPDLLLLDHTLSGGFGLDILLKIEKIQNTVPLFILLTGDAALGPIYNHFIKQSIGYLHKDNLMMLKQHLLEGVKTAYEMRFPFIRINGSIFPLKDLLYIEAHGNDSVLHYTDKTEEVTTRLGVIAQMPTILKRCHRSYLVNPLRITAITAEYIYFGQIPLPLSATYKANFQDL